LGFERSISILLKAIRSKTVAHNFVAHISTVETNSSLNANVILFLAAS